MRKFPAAPWCMSLVVMSIVGMLLLFVVTYFARGSVPPGSLGGVPRMLVTLLPFIIGSGAALFVVSAYHLDAHGLRIQRLLWQTSIPLDGLERVWQDRDAMKGSIKVFGNGGLFAYSGVFQNAGLGRYRAFVTNPQYTVVLRRSRGAVVVTPANPEAFVRQVQAFFPGVRVGAPDQNP